MPLDISGQLQCQWLLCVVYFKQLSGAARTRKMVKKLFLSRFQPFFCYFKPFSVISCQKSRKNDEKMNQNSILSIFVYSSKLVNMQMLVYSLREYLEFVFFWLIFYKKGWKRLKKVFWPAFGCAQHPKAHPNTQQLWVFELLVC